MTGTHFDGRLRRRFDPDTVSTPLSMARGRRDPRRADRPQGDIPGDASAFTGSRRRHEHGPLRENGRRGDRGDDRGRGGESRKRAEGRGRGRAQRGDVRAAILLLLADQPMHGYQLMHAITERTNGAWRPSPGAIYPTIAALEDEQLVSVAANGGRKLVSLNDNGRQYLQGNADTIADPFTAITEHGGGRNDLRSSVDQLHIAARAVGDTGTQAQVASAQGILEQARRSLYLILATPTETQDEGNA